MSGACCGWKRSYPRWSGLWQIFRAAIAAEGVFAEIGEVAAGTKPGRQTPGEITLFKSLGLAVEDVVTAELVFQKATKDHTPDATTGQG